MSRRGMLPSELASASSLAPLRSRSSSKQSEGSCGADRTIASRTGASCQHGHQAIDADRYGAQLAAGAAGAARKKGPPRRPLSCRPLARAAGRSPRPRGRRQARRTLAKAAGTPPGPPDARQARRVLGRWLHRPSHALSMNPAFSIPDASRRSSDWRGGPAPRSFTRLLVIKSGVGDHRRQRIVADPNRNEPALPCGRAACAYHTVITAVWPSGGNPSEAAGLDHVAAGPENPPVAGAS
jgi:hypothetical protein